MTTTDSHIVNIPVTTPGFLQKIKVPYALITLLGLLVLWELATIVFDVPAYLLPAPTTIVNQIVKNWWMLLSHAGVTTYEIILGFVVSVAIGIPLAVAITSSRAVDRAIYPLIVGSQTIPKVALAPLMLAWFGFGLTPKIMIVVLVAFFPIVINTVVGLRSATPLMINLARSMGASPMQVFWKFKFPQALPNVFAGMKMATVLAVIGAIVAEFVGADAGLGYVIMIAGSNFDIPLQFAAIVVLSLIGVVLFWIASIAERVCLPWHISIRSEQE